MKRKIYVTAILILCIVFGFGLSRPLFASSIDEEKQKQKEMEKDLADSESMLNDLEALKSDTAAYVKALDEKLNTLTASIDDLNKKATEKQSEIDATNVQLEEKQQEIEEQYAAMKVRIQYMFESGNDNYMDMIFESATLADFLNKAEYISEISKYDRNMLQRLEDTRIEIQTAKETLEADKQELAKLQEQTKAEQASVQALVDSKSAQLEATERQIVTAQNDIEDQQGEIAAQKQIIAELEAIEKKRKEEEARRKAQEEESRKQAEAQGKNESSNTQSSTSGSSSGTGVFTWPLPGYSKISSEYGYRISPISGKSEFHSGLDIPAPSGTQIVAADSGVVAWSYLSSSAGNWVGIDHGNGLYTIYMHMTKSMVNEGQKVKKGEVIGLVGSTGWSTGPHLHFSIRLNGEYVNPWSYLK